MPSDATEDKETWIIDNVRPFSLRLGCPHFLTCVPGIGLE